MDLSSNRILDIGVFSIVRCLESNFLLEVLRLLKNNFKNNGVSVFLNFIIKNGDSRIYKIDFIGIFLKEEFYIIVEESRKLR